MLKERLTAFSDGVVAIIITIMVLELKAPHEASFSALAALTPTFLAYALSFAYIAIYWNNHHHLFQATRRVTGAILWAFSLRSTAHVATLVLGFLLMGLMGARHFGRFHGGNAPGEANGVKR